MTVNSIMSSLVVSVCLYSILAKVNQIFTRKTFHHLLIVENKKHLDVIPDRYLLKTLSPHIGIINWRDTIKISNKRQEY